ncbi:MAG TPA: S-methyl-5-thioribose-1-phosphate isomerase [Acidimicrobiia bacterium]|nr:S-methyl-5-thioribose-1-phosphate isomerase [Acidimicrobiia bacterium]
MRREPIPPTIEWSRGAVRILDQRALPATVRFRRCATVDQLCDAIATLAVRGAPALEAAGAYGVALAAHTRRSAREVRSAARRIARTRPTAVNLSRGVACALEAYERGGADAALDAARALAARDVERNRAIGGHGASLVPNHARVLTVCNTGSLATVGYGTALGVVRAAAESGRRPSVLAAETRPLLQGARLTMWELQRLRIPARVIVDGAAGALMAAGEVDLVIVGADRIAANGDVANKIGTYSLAVLARHHDIPFVVAAPTATIDLPTSTGDAIVIEERAPDEVVELAGVRTAPPGALARNPAFDVTPARLVTAIVTEVGVVRPPYRRSVPAAVRRAAEEPVRSGS